ASPALLGVGEPAGGVALGALEADPPGPRGLHRADAPDRGLGATPRPAGDLRGRAAHARGRGRARGRGGPHRARDDPQGVRAGGHARPRGAGAPRGHVLPRGHDPDRPDPADAPRAAPLAGPGVRGEHRPDRRGALHQGPAAVPRRAAAHVRPPPAPAPALLRAWIQAGRRAAPRVPGQEASPGNRGGRVRGHRGAGHARGPARGAGGRDPGRVRRGRAPHPAGDPAPLPRPRPTAHRRAEHRNRAADPRRLLRYGRRLGARSLRPRAAQGREEGGRRRPRRGREGGAHASAGGAGHAPRDGRKGRGVVIYVWIIGLAMLITALFSAAEMSVIAANRVRLLHLAEGGHRTAIRYLEAFRHPERLLSTAMMGVTLAHITASTVATWALIPYAGGTAALLVTVVLTPLMLVFGEVIPKA